MKKVNPSGIKMELLLSEKLKNKIKPYGLFQPKSTYQVKEERREEEEKRREEEEKREEKKE